MARYLIAAAALGGVSAVLYLSVLATPAGLILSGFAQAPLFVAGLTLGLAGAIAASAAAALLAMMALGLAGGLAYALVNTLPVLVLVQRALLSRRAADGGVEWYTAGLLTTWLTGLGLLARSDHEVLDQQAAGQGRRRHGRAGEAFLGRRRVLGRLGRLLGSLRLGVGARTRRIDTADEHDEEERETEVGPGRHRADV